MRRVVGLLLVLFLVLAAIADRVSVVELFLRLPGWIKTGLGWMTPPEDWLAARAIHPLPLALALICFFALVVTPGDLRRWLGLNRLQASADRRAAGIDAAASRAARDEFRWGIARCYRRYAAREQMPHQTDDLVRLIDALRFPAGFPLRGDEAPQVSWPSADDPLWIFTRRAFANALDPDADDLLGTDYRAFLRATCASARFWDDWARDRKGRAARAEIAAHAREIKLLALAQLALVETMPWEEGAMSGLFALARET
jgi:hypothetical protein